MNKKVMLFVVIAVLVLLAAVIALRSRCSYWNFASPVGEDCNCIGIKTDGCPAGAMCDKAIGFCYGIRTACYNTNLVNQTREQISCG